MKKLLVLILVLGLATVSQAVPTMISLADGGLTITVAPGTVRLNISSSVNLIGLDALVLVSGGDVITGAMNSTDAGSYGWDPASFPINPVGLGTALVEVGGATFGAAPAGTVAYIDVLYTGGTQVISIAPGTAFGGSYDTSYVAPTFSSGVVTLIPEPTTMLILSLGGLLLRRKK